MKNKQHWEGKLVSCTAGGPELQKQSAQHSILVIITIDQISSSVLSKTIYMYVLCFTIKTFKLHVMVHLHTVFRLGRPSTPFQHDMEKKLWNEVTVINPLQS